MTWLRNGEHLRPLAFLGKLENAYDMKDILLESFQLLLVEPQFLCKLNNLIR